MQFTAYGLNIDSEIDLPELRRRVEGAPDVSIRYALSSDDLPGAKRNNPGWQSKENQLLLTIKDVAKYFILEGREIRIERSANSREEDIRVFLLGSVLGALMHQRNILTLHASAIRCSRGAVLFMGPSGYGKSTLAGSMLQRGYSMIADDKTGVVLNGCDPPQ